ncbi:putative diheme cytochrome c-553 [alpha proteobacterium U9-1i]|nr:putative diheme cytochrome c-553 [alpha proteobacterium U9-1i]
MRIFAFAALAAALAACAPQTSEPTEADLVARGDYLVNGVVLCGDCHTPRLETGAPDETRKLHGADLQMPPPLATLAPQLAGIPSNYTREQFTSFLQTGARPDGSQPRPPMPPYRLNADDARAVTAYIASLPAAQ